MVEVSTLSYNQLLSRYHKISVPDYQRPYRWSEEKVGELLEDLEEFFIFKTQPNHHSNYYIGSILLYHKEDTNQYEIIDGQQRLTTLTLLYYSIYEELLEGQNFCYNNHISFNNIRKNLQYLEDRLGLLLQLNEEGLFDKLIFTLIISKNEDNSFAFFDSQNNRGVTLAADDYLKAYHLRAVSSETLQEKLAKQWERSVLRAQKEEDVEAGLLHLFYKILYKSREWKGQQSFIPEDKDAILKAFQKKTYRSENKNSYYLYPGRSNIKYISVHIDDNDQEHFLVRSELFSSDAEFPLSLRQPLYKGHNFFKFTQKYYAVHQLLFQNHLEGSEALSKTQYYYKNVYTNNMSVYLRHFMQLCLVMYYDVFKENKLDKAIAYFDYFIGSIRVSKHYVRKEAVKNSLLNASNNLLDVIANAFIPEEIFDFIAEQSEIRRIYEVERLERNNGVRSSYKQRVLDFYDRKEFSLKNRLQWIN